MTGICGIIGFEDKDLLRRMCGVTNCNREDSGIFLDTNVGLCSIDVTGKKQLIHNEDESIWAVCDGEIYNYEELKEEMEEFGHKFYTSIDAEVIVHLYEELGDLFVGKLNGMFSFAILDSNEKKVLLARDQIGIKSLHYTIFDKSLLFASEIKSILQYESVKREMDIGSLNYLLNLQYIPGNSTMFKNVKRVLPGHILVYKNGTIHLHKYWDISVRHHPQKSEEYYITHFLKLFRKSVKQRLMNSTSTGAFLSGGMDSSSVVAMMRSLTDEPIKSFCLGFGESTDDLNYARIVAEHFETDHHEIIVEPQEMKNLPEAIWWMDEPIVKAVDYYLVSKLVSKHVDVVLNGRGGDELFGGYQRFKYIYMSKDLQKIVPQYLSTTLSRLVETFQSKYSKLEWAKYNKYLRIISAIGNKEKFYMSIAPTFLGDGTKVYSNKLLYENSGNVEDAFNPYFNTGSDFVTETLLAEIKEKLVNEFLTVEDRVSVANSMKGRFPLLDRDLVEFSFTIPSHLKVRNMGNTRKYILRKAMSRILPKDIINRPKGGAFGFEPCSLFGKELRELALNILPESDIIKAYFRPDYIKHILQHRLNSNMATHYDLIKMLLCLEIWHKIYIENDDVCKPKLVMSDFY